ncbi:L-threonylcarbamoyladenylate synthase [Microbacterium sp. No. 7]|uniref:L-threonylcarbamoyladenylate synthase n=1 Tax=Microbacterium sp. No. 7 TaxID=1714373 RepID=UPI0006D1A35D|nr:Sua5/YciO/YrdC/YwlC family protein [Microbacterium sp. No. 7]ALJ19795.1 translation factor (SUA5) [Microbacterium sp. No. 7]
MPNTTASAPTVRWNGGLQHEAVELLRSGGGLVVSPTKVGYVIVAVDAAGLERKFEVKRRPRRKPGVVLCGSLDQLVTLAELSDEVEGFYRTHWRQDVLLGCILPWTRHGRAHIPPGAEELVMDDRATSCFVVRFGEPGERIARALWDRDHTVLFASSANPSGQGNRGRVDGIGERIARGVDLVIEADDYVRSVQPDTGSRYEQGVMVSFVDGDGELVPEQRGARGVSPAPTVIRGGLAQDRIVANLAAQFPTWDYRHGQHY